jgi:hypothetical protein
MLCAENTLWCANGVNGNVNGTVPILVMIFKYLARPTRRTYSMFVSQRGYHQLSWTRRSKTATRRRSKSIIAPYGDLYLKSIIAPFGDLYLNVSFTRSFSGKAQIAIHASSYADPGRSIQSGCAGGQCCHSHWGFSYHWIRYKNIIIKRIKYHHLKNLAESLNEKKNYEKHEDVKYKKNTMLSEF